jgi:arylsulfatase A-like enzyme/Flp pilus assembly protein TadD
MTDIMSEGPEATKEKRPYLRLYLILLVLVLLVVVVIWIYHNYIVSPKQIRHIVLISIDTCRPDYLSCYGYPLKTTPNIDAIAAEGTLFENAITTAPITLPAHSSMLTGTTPPYHGVHDNYYRLDQTNETLAEIMRQNGFQTGAIVGSFVMDAQFGLDQGFQSYNDRFDEKVAGSVMVERRAEEVSRYGLKWLQQHQHEPFFLFLHYFDPHMSYDPPEPFASTFQHNPYAGEIAYTDRCIGLVLSKLLIIITSDHGEMLGEHGEKTHSFFIYQSAIKVPLIFKLPRQRKSRRIDGLAGLIDIVPTVCSLLGIQSANQMQGKDLSGWLSGENMPDEKRHIYCESLCPTIYKANSLLGVVTDRYKYIQTTRPELYDLVQDPYETSNLVKEQPRRAQLMQGRLKQMLEQTARESKSGANPELDEQSRETLESLGYVAGSVSEDFSFDLDKEDPKDLIAFHSVNSKMYWIIFEKKFDEAKELCRKMLSERPDYEGIYRYLGWIAEKEGDKDKAIDYMTEALKLNPNELRTRNRLGTMLVAQGKTEEAIEHFFESLRVRPDQVEAHKKLGSLFKLQGKIDEAISHYRQALQIKSNDAKAHNGLGVEVVQLTSDSASAHHTLARSLKDAGRAKEAIVEFKETLRVKPDSVRAMNSLAWLLATHKEDKLRGPEEAIRLAERACELTNYKDAGIVDTLAAAYASAGRFSDAAATAEKALKLIEPTGDTERAQNIKKRLQLYKRGQGYSQ